MCEAICTVVEIWPCDNQPVSWWRSRSAKSSYALFISILVLPELAWVEIESPVVEEDGGFKVAVIPEPVGHLLDGLNFRVEPLADGIGDTVVEVGDDIRPVALEQRGHLSHRIQPRMSRPPEPAVPEAFGLLWRGVIP